MKPSEVIVNTEVPLGGTFGRVELEAGAAMLVAALAENGDTWRAIRWSEVLRCGDVIRALPWMSNPFVHPDVVGLANAGFVVRNTQADSYALTVEAVRILEASRWNRAAWERRRALRSLAGFVASMLEGAQPTMETQRDMFQCFVDLGLEDDELCGRLLDLTPAPPTEAEPTSKDEHPSPATFQIAAREGHRLAAEVYDAVGSTAIHTLSSVTQSTGMVRADLPETAVRTLLAAGCIANRAKLGMVRATAWGRFVLSTGGAR